MSERLHAIVAAMNIQPHDEVLEIGCGQGVAMTLICEKLETGRILAIDRSAKMIAAATRRNQRYIDSGMAELRVTDVLDFDPGEQRFDKILAVRVGVLHRDTGKLRSRIEKWLKPGGRMFLIYDEP
jgi:cyclopropane fatty-acyl-phospholipid synthase-like methyltransferase